MQHPGALAFVLAATTVIACGDSPSQPPGGANPDASAADAAPADGPVDAGPCDGRIITAKLSDLDSTPGAPAPIAGAKVTVTGMPARTTTTSATGEFTLCAPATPTMTFDVDAPEAHVDGKLFLEEEALHCLYPLDVRLFTPARAVTLFPFQGDRAQVLVYLAGDRNDLMIDAAHADVVAGNDDDFDGTYDWEHTTAGRYVLFPNVTGAGATTTLHGDLSGPHDIPIAPGKVTLVGLCFVFL